LEKPEVSAETTPKVYEKGHKVLVFFLIYYIINPSKQQKQEHGEKMARASATLSRRVYHMRWLTWYLLEGKKCHFCKKPLVTEGFSIATQIREITMHHKDGNHYNEEPKNRSFAHVTCHKSWHMSAWRKKQEAAK
jgi:hypothetical protein